MAEGEVLVVFDPFVLASAFSGETGPESEALSFLLDHCSHRLIWDDKLGKLQSAYAKDLPGGTLGLIRGRVQEDDLRRKLRIRAGPSPIGVVPGLRRQHDLFLSAALAVRPHYIVTGIRQFLPLAGQVQRDFGVSVLAPVDYAALTREAGG